MRAYAVFLCYRAITVAAFAAMLAVMVPPEARSQDAEQPAANAAPPPAVTIIGRRPRAETLNAVVTDFVRSHGRYSPRLDQLTRWREPVCPLVRNVPADFETFISTRIQTVAQSVGAPLKVPCKPNVEIIFAEQPQAIMDAVVRKNPAMLGFHFVHQTANKARMTLPIQAWYVTATSNGMVTSIDDPYLPMPGGAAGSRLSVGLMSVFNHILILVDTDKVIGLQLGAVADYLALLTLAQLPPQGDCAQLSSIMDLFSDACPTPLKPKALTAADKAYLEGLYSMPETAVGSLQRSAIVNHMLHSLDAP